VYTGLRAGELWALRRRDVDALRGELLVDEAIKEVTAATAAKVPESQRITPSLIVGPTKTYAKRKVSVPAFLRDELAAHLGRSLPGGDGPEAFIFTTPTGEPIRHNLFYKRVFSPAVAATFPGRALRFHDLRHTCAAWLIDAGAHPLQIKLRLGHKEIRTTMDTYGHLFPSAEPEMAGLLEAGYRAAEPTPARPICRWPTRIKGRSVRGVRKFDPIGVEVNSVEGGTGLGYVIGTVMDLAIRH
jgi:integrase